MSEPNNIRKTPRIVDGAAHLPDRPPTEDELKYPLPAFFYEMRNVPFDEWTDFQVRRAVRQGQYVEQHDIFWHEIEEDEDGIELKQIILSIASGTIPEKLD